MKASHETPYGKVYASAWTLKDGALRAGRVEIPANTRATVRLPERGSRP